MNLLQYEKAVTDTVQTQHSTQDQLNDFQSSAVRQAPIQTNLAYQSLGDGVGVETSDGQLADENEGVETSETSAASDDESEASEELADHVSVSITISNINATNTPAGVGDRIPPRINTTVTVTVSGWSLPMRPITLSMEGGGAANGNATINGAATHDVTATGTVTLQGTTQTAPGNAGNLKLVGHIGGDKVGESNGFTVCAIPETVTVSFANLITGPKRGIAMTTSNDSDSGNIADLDQVEMSELVQYVNGTGCFAGINSGNNSGYLAANRNPHGVDSHSTPVSLITAAGEIDSEQGFVFKDMRSGVNDIPVTNSGFNINRTVVDNSGNLNITTSKAPWSGTVRGATVSAGSGSASRTQAK